MIMKNREMQGGSAMKITRKLAVVDTTNRMTIAFDVSKGSLSYYSEIQGKLTGTSCKEIQAVEGEVSNTVSDITKALDNLLLFAKLHNHCGLHVVCEPTGTYSDALMRLARQHDCTTAWVNGEVVNKAKVIENNDNSKSDLKDPRVIFMLSTMGKEQTHRLLPGHYQALRELNRAYDAEEQRRISMICEVQLLVGRLFVDFPMSKDFIFDKSGATLMELYSFSPYRIAVHTVKRFFQRMRKKYPHIHPSTLKKLHEAAKRSINLCIPSETIEAIEQRLRFVWDDYLRADLRRSELRKQIGAIYQKLWDAGEQVPQADEKVLTTFLLGRVLGETGPLSNFTSWELLLKYAGLNLRVRESGKYKGKLKLSKKGRASLRLILGRAIFRMIKQNAVFGEYYHRRKNEDKLNCKQLTAILERKLLRIIFACAQQRATFDIDRMTKCESQYRKAA
jgi:transposase